MGKKQGHKIHESMKVVNANDLAMALLKVCEVHGNDTPVAISTDPEGNYYRWIEGLQVIDFDADPEYSEMGEPMLFPDEAAKYDMQPNTPEELQRAIPVITLWPL